MSRVLSAPEDTDVDVATFINKHIFYVKFSRPAAIEVQGSAHMSE